MKVIIVLAVLLGLAAAYTSQEYQDAFSSWMTKYNKVYSNDEFQSRFQIFQSNMDYVRDWNANNQQTVLGLTIFADLSNDEYQKIYLGTHFDASERLRRANPLKLTTVLKPKVTANETGDIVNWVTKGAVTGIKNQGQCGSCWSFSTTGSVEGAHFLSTNNLVSLSEQNLMDCSTSYGNAGCNGGLMDDAFAYIIANHGIDTEASYPYTAVDGTSCGYKAANSGATISSYKDVTSGSETALATSANKQPISVAIDASHNSFQLYTSGIYYEPACSTTQLDHGVLVVGYGTDDTGAAYWLVKNSWGTTWGMSGYIWMSRNRGNNCGIATMASYPIV
jgi:cathepsin L